MASIIGIAAVVAIATCPNTVPPLAAPFDANVDRAFGRSRPHITGARTEWRPPPYAITTSNDQIRFEVRNTDLDRSPKDKAKVRRSEIALEGIQLSNDVEYWDAFGIIPHPYSNPSSMSETRGGLFYQIKIPGNGSPILGMRRTSDDELLITTKPSDQPGMGTIRYHAAWTLNEAHYFVRRMVFSPRSASLDVWLDGRQIVHAENIEMGSDNPKLRAYPKIGAYYAGGLGTDPCSSVTNTFFDYHPPQLKPLEVQPPEGIGASIR